MKAARDFAAGRKKLLVDAVRSCKSEDEVRAFLAFMFIGVLIVLVFWPPDGADELVSSVRTLAIAVIAFYFGMHGHTPQKAPNGGVPPPGPESPETGTEYRGADPELAPAGKPPTPGGEATEHE